MESDETDLARPLLLVNNTPKYHKW